jgi:hypothetical protein
LSYVTLNHPDRKVRLEDIDGTFLRDFTLRIVSRILLFCYAFLLFKPAVPFVKDRLAHTFFYAQHVRTVHVENGKEHVHYEVKKASADTEKGRSSNSMQKAEAGMDVCVLPTSPNIILSTANSPEVNAYKAFLFILRYIEPEDHPPQVQGSLT